MIYYEMLMILNPDISQDNYDTIKQKIESQIIENNGIIKNYDRWGKYLLAYKIKKNSYGIYVLLRFGVSQSVIHTVLENIRNLCTLRFNLTVMRYVFVRLGKSISDSYCRPDSLEDAPRREKAYDIDEVIARKNRNNQKTSNHRRNRNFEGALLLEEDNFQGLNTTHQEATINNNL